jgi:hypothetical protein
VSARQVTLLPLPLSPTTASVSPDRSRKPTPWTTLVIVRRSRKLTRRSRTSSSGGVSPWSTPPQTFILGSTMSRSASPRTLNAITVTKIATPGVSSHQKLSMNTFMSFCAWLSIRPQEADGS